MSKQDDKLRSNVHRAMLDVSESLRELADKESDLTVVPLGHAVDVALQMIHKKRHEDYLFMADALMDRRITADEALKEWEQNQLDELGMLLGSRVVVKDWMPDGTFLLATPQSKEGE